MTKKLEYAEPTYHCRVLKELQKEGFDWMALGKGITIPLKSTICIGNPTPNCRRCSIHKENQWVFDKGVR